MKCPKCHHEIVLKKYEYFTSSNISKEDRDLHTNDYQLICPKCSIVLTVSEDVGAYPY